MDGLGDNRIVMRICIIEDNNAVRAREWIAER
jgi:hypothetical protein